jgi:lysophospholipase L1-like esterase
VWGIHYPELGLMATAHERHAAEPDRFEVILLGGSVLEQVAPDLERALGRRLGDRVKLHCLAKSAHTSRDSYLKYVKLMSFDADLLIIYHGINDVRMNCVERSEFRDDYSHCAWYQAFYDRLAHGAPSLFAIASESTLHSIVLGAPDDKRIAYGADVKTEAGFRRNIASIVGDASRRGIPVILMSFAYHLPANYSRELFEQGALDYGDGIMKLPAELWGLPANVAKTLDIHNSVIKELSNSYKNVTYIDQQSLLPKEGRIFSDPCHFTEAGCQEFARNIAENLPATLAKRPRRVAAGAIPAESIEFQETNGSF